MDKKALEQEILTSGYEDSTGLWEVIWYLNSTAPELPQETKIELSRSILKRLLQQGEVVLYKLNELKKIEEELSRAEALGLLNVDGNWDTPDVVGQELRYMNTEKGDKALSRLWEQARS